ncbi:hypothetical protein NCER_100524 [Vairimorpha ceranae BRL01]|uniref:Uncharacterized protein n=2 Tax=Vairimorpha ceranae TaxID=40302 RepID=C4V7T4_VAIC1|nr:hypothetical protein AAJ76_7100015230 [Vairimorpha ceranae]EEQ82708.1 hypothetical protein NCER_100524 [Vairimorpha ceranae BRL01]KAF5139902.1 hypothetical protein G9O61_00g019210 [Vairimorpha ceranae]KKO74449.1 hypothetical protein AAJ76_7100015230 [Vairimorpha ceranae]
MFIIFCCSSIFLCSKYNECLENPDECLKTVKKTYANMVKKNKDPSGFSYLLDNFGSKTGSEFIVFRKKNSENNEKKDKSAKDKQLVSKKAVKNISTCDHNYKFEISNIDVKNMNIKYVDQVSEIFFEILIKHSSFKRAYNILKSKRKVKKNLLKKDRYKSYVLNFIKNETVIANYSSVKFLRSLAFNSYRLIYELSFLGCYNNLNSDILLLYISIIKNIRVELDDICFLKVKQIFDPLKYNILINKVIFLYSTIKEKKKKACIMLPNVSKKFTLENHETLNFYSPRNLVNELSTSTNLLQNFEN